MTNFVFYSKWLILYFGLCFCKWSVFVCLFFLSNSQALPCQFSQIQVVHLCECACVCAHVRAHVLAQMGVASEGTACCCVKRMVFFNCAGNPRLKTGDAIAKVRWLWRSLVMLGKISQLTPHFCFRIDYPKLSSKQPLRETALHFLSISALPPEVFSPSGLLQAT